MTRQIYKSMGKHIIPLLIMFSIMSSIFIFPKHIVYCAQEPGFYYNLGVSYYDKGMINEAISAWEKTIEINPEYVVAYYNLGNAYEEKGMLGGSNFCMGESDRNYPARYRCVF